MRLLVTGSRQWDDNDRLCAELDAVAAEAAAAGDAELVLVHGDCRPQFKNGKYLMRSADFLADRWAKRLGHPVAVTVEPHPADWKRCVPGCKPGHRKPRPGDSSTTYCPDAGPRRNAGMVALGADLVVAFFKGPSRGTTHCANLAEAAGLPVKRIEADRAAA